MRKLPGKEIDVLFKTSAEACQTDGSKSATLHSRLVIVMSAILACFGLTSAFVVWSLLQVERSATHIAEEVNEELTPILDIEGDVRKAQLAGWTAAFAIQGGAPVTFVRAEYDSQAHALDEALADLSASGLLREELPFMDAATAEWEEAKSGYEEAFTGGISEPIALAQALSAASAHVDRMVSELDKAQNSAREEMVENLGVARQRRNTAVIVAAVALIVGFALTSFITRAMCGGVVGAIGALREGARKLSSGEWGHRVELEGPRELEQLSSAFNTMSDRLAQSHTALEHRAFHDQLTGLGNRLAMTDRLEQAAAARENKDRSDAFLVLDLNHFKDVNDTRGHAFGDLVLVAASRRISGCLDGRGTIFRLGGDEFGILIEGLTDPEEAAAVADRIVDAMSRPVEVEGIAVRVPASIGITHSRAGQAAADMIIEADLAMYQAKRTSGGSWQCFSDELKSKADDRVSLAEDLRAAISAGNIDVAYQAVYDSDRTAPIGFEALARWTHPTQGPVSPGRFIPLAESTGLIGALGRHVLHVACHDAAQWREQHPNIAVSVNIGATHLEEEDFVDQVTTALHMAGLEANALTLEVTESTVIAHQSDGHSKLEALRSRGVRVAIDDFGTGFSSLASVRNYPIDVLKIDRSFVIGVDEDMRQRALVETIIALTRNLELGCIIEGVETAEQLDVLRAAGGRLIQGFLFHRPSPVADARALLEESVPQRVS